jgi:hypothetical protein
MSTGFKDPDGEFPRSDYGGAATTNKASREEWEPYVKLPDGTENLELVSTDWQPKYPYNKVEETSSGHRIETDDTPGEERLSFVHKDGSGIEMYPNTQDATTFLINSVGRQVQLVGDDFVMIVNGNGDVHYKGNLNLNVDGDFNIACTNFTVTTTGKQIEEIRQEKIENFVGDRVVTTQGSKSEVVLGNYTVESMGNSHFVSKKNTRITAEDNIDIFAGDDMRLTAEGTMTSSAMTNRLIGLCTSVVGNTGTFGGQNMVMYAKTYHGDVIGTAERARYATDTDPDAVQTAMPTTANLTEGLTKTKTLGIRNIDVDDGRISSSVKSEVQSSGSSSNTAQRPDTFGDDPAPTTTTREGRSGVGDFNPDDPATERYNNPGGMYPASWQEKYGAVSNSDRIGGGHSIAGFATKEQGAAAHMALLKEGKYYRNESISGAINTWSGGNNVNSYLSSLQAQGIDTSKNVSFYTSTKAGTIKLAKAMSFHETGRKFSLSDQGWSNAYDLGNSKGWL